MERSQTHILTRIVSMTTSGYRTVGGPIEIVKIILIIVTQMNWLFEGFNMLKNVLKFAVN